MPYLQTLGLIPAVLLAGIKSLETGQDFWAAAGLVLLVFLLVQAIQEIVLVPRILGGATGLGPLRGQQGPVPPPRRAARHLAVHRPVVFRPVAGGARSATSIPSAGSSPGQSTRWSSYSSTATSFSDTIRPLTEIPA